MGALVRPDNAFKINAGCTRYASRKKSGTTELTAGRGSRAGGAGSALLEGRRHDLLGEVEVLPEVLDALHGQVPVEVLPAWHEAQRSDFGGGR